MQRYQHWLAITRAYTRKFFIRIVSGTGRQVVASTIMRLNDKVNGKRSVISFMLGLEDLAFIVNCRGMWFCRRPHRLHMAIEQQRVHVAGRRAGLANLEEIRLAAILLLDCPRRWRMSELDLGFANPLHHGDECGTLAPVARLSQAKAKIRQSTRTRQTSGDGDSARFQMAANKASQPPEKEALNILSKLERAQVKGEKKNWSSIDDGLLHKEHGNVRDSESRSRYFLEGGNKRLWWQEFGGLGSTSTLYKILRVTFRCIFSSICLKSSRAAARQKRCLGRWWACF